jgi:hypothetical protein
MSQNEKQVLQQNDPDEPQSLDFIFDQIKYRMEIQKEHISVLDKKSNFDLASATILTASIAGLQKISGPSKVDMYITLVSQEIVVNIITLTS